MKEHTHILDYELLSPKEFEVMRRLFGMPAEITLSVLMYRLSGMEITRACKKYMIEKLVAKQYLKRKGMRYCCGMSYKTYQDLWFWKMADIFHEGSRKELLKSAVSIGFIKYQEMKEINEAFTDRYMSEAMKKVRDAEIESTGIVPWQLHPNAQ